MLDKITQRGLDAFKRKVERRKAAAYLWDTELKGFGLYASARGDVSWLVQRWIGGRQGKRVRYAFDHYPRLSLDDARAQASTLLGEIRNGVDLVDRRRKERMGFAAEVNGATLLDTFERYHKRNHKDGVYWQQVDRSFRNEIAPKLGKDALVAKITKAEVRKLIEAKLDAGLDGAARNQFAILRPFFTWCVQQDVIAVSPMDTLANPSPAKSRDRSLTTAEIKLLWSASDKLGYPFGPFYRLCLLTGQRREEVAGMQWEELNLEMRLWTIPGKRTKNGREHIVHLSNQALAVLATIDRIESVPFVFSTTGKSSISGFTKAKEALDKAMGIELDPEAPGFDPKRLWWVHDLRRTLVSTLAELGFPTDVADRLLNHVSGSSKDGVKGVYQRYEFLPERKRAIETWGKWVENTVTEAPKASNIHQLRG